MKSSGKKWPKSIALMKEIGILPSFMQQLQELQINFSSYEHPAVLTVEAQAKYVGHLGGALSKNLFLKDKKHRFYVVSALAGTTVDLKVLSQRLGLGKGGLRMAPEEALQDMLQVPLGTVTPFALINESARAVSLLLDKGFKAQECCFFHPLSNEVTISLSTLDLDKFLISIGRNPTYVDLEASPLVGKDQPADLAALVPSETPSLVGAPEKAVQSPASAGNHAPTANKSTKNAGEPVSGVNGPKAAKEKTTVTADRVAAADIKRFIDEIIEKTCAAVLTEVNKGSEDQPKALESLLDKVSKHIRPDLESVTMSLKNAAYAEGFHAGLLSAINRGFQGLPSRSLGPQGHLLHRIVVMALAMLGRTQSIACRRPPEPSATTVDPSLASDEAFVAVRTSDHMDFWPRLVVFSEDSGGLKHRPCLLDAHAATPAMSDANRCSCSVVLWPPH
ncbi:hypothetical protein Taro_031011 [Colocasia esculenta]|uniref:YbaK/aminoacyl-tRNA synthetase-associated domain-containing protein n=1 Tax=Colocasia esculenta TaxID=4460 RepID=A0A843VXT6_COLES|nr:hypothetical protein [Colocasia esculenta]